MENDQFFEIIRECLNSKPHKGLEARLRLSINKEIARVYKAYTDRKHDFATLTYELLTDNERFQFIKGLRENTIYEFKLILTYIFPILKRARPKYKLRLKRTNYKTINPPWRGVLSLSLKVSKNSV